ncbi:endoglucanase [Eubacterium ruminantium]|nr:endoglucanase [Eubacterium ruminantium]
MKKRVRKIAALMAIMAVGTGLFGCGKESDDKKKSENGTTTAVEKSEQNKNTDDSTAAVTENTKDTENSTAGGGTGLDLENMSSTEFAVYLGNGYNLGNTMEAADSRRTGDYINNPVSYFETLWGQPITTPEMLRDMKEAGLDTVRIPVAWHNAMDFTNGNYEIKKEYLDRVKEIIDYAYDAGLYVVVNDHWDSGWWGLFGSADESKRESAMEQYISMWQQISEYYKDYDYRLIFEGGNEEIGDRLNDIDATWNPDGGKLSKDECYSKSNEINQTFVDTVRATGGNNEKRFLLIPGYGTDITQTLDKRWHMPADTAEDRLLLSVHYYTPWSYCGSTGSTTWGTKKNYEEMNTLMKNLSVFSENGYGIIIGECGVLPTSNGEMKPNWKLWYQNFFANCDLYGYVPLLWDTGNILNKNTHKWMEEDVKSFLIENSYDSQKDKTPEEIKAAAEKTIEDGLAAAPESFDKNQLLAGDGKAVAWIMWDSEDWNIVYAVGDTYDPDSKTGGIVATDVEVTGEGTYTIGLDFTGTDAGVSHSTAFSAIGIANGEELFPGYIINIKEIKINGEEYTMHGRNYTSSDDGLCTRSNLYNEWVPSVPAEARTSGGGTMGCSPTVLDKATLGDVKTIEITFDYLPGEQGISTNDANSKN